MYQTVAEAEARLQTRFNITAELTIGDVMLAGLDLDGLAPFEGEKTDPGQAREFPRDGAAETPDAVLDWVALRAYALVSEEREGVTRRRVDVLSVEHAPAYSQTARRLQKLLDPYLQRIATRV
jgi:hypothetical protein